MTERNFKVIRGGAVASIRNNTRTFKSAFVTDTRLMGVVGLYISWELSNKNYKSDFHQFFYFDAEEYGFETYKGLIGDDEVALNVIEQTLIGGLGGDAGLTGRKIIVDTYGGYSRHGGGAFSGKDPTKVDRSATYAARYVAKNIVAAGLATKCEIGLAYAIGVAKPVSILVDTFGTGKISDQQIAELVDRHFDLRPSAIIKNLDLRRPIYRQVAAYGHFGRTDLDLPWEKIDKAEILKQEGEKFL